MTSPIFSRTSRRNACALGSLALISFALAGCGADESTTLGSSEQSVLYGQVSGPEDDAVIMVDSTTTTVIHHCSGTLVAPNLVLTARHCVASFVDAMFTCTSSGDLAPGSQGGTIGANLDPSQISARLGQGPSPPTVAHGTAIFTTQTPSICRNDIALVVLDKSIPNALIKPLRLDAGNTPGDIISVIGYGVDENNQFGIRHLRTGLAISLVGSSQFRATGDAIPPRTFVTDGPALCIGDSGGPAFADTGAITAVWSQVVGECTADSARNYYTQVAPFKDELVLPAFAAANAMPWLEGTTGPGVPGDAGASSGGASSGEGGAPSGQGGSASGSVTSSAGDSSSGGSGAQGGMIQASGGSSGTSSEAGTSGDFGLRKKGGCTCSVASGSSTAWQFLAAPACALAALLRRRRRSSRASR